MDGREGRKEGDWVGRKVIGWEGRRDGGKGRRKEENVISKQMAKRPLARG